MNMNERVNNLNTLSNITKTQPHTGFAAFTHGIRYKFVYLTRTTPNIKELLKPSDKSIDGLTKEPFFDKKNRVLEEWGSLRHLK